MPYKKKELPIAKFPVFRENAIVLIAAVLDQRPAATLIVAAVLLRSGVMNILLGLLVEPA